MHSYQHVRRVRPLLTALMTGARALTGTTFFRAARVVTLAAALSVAAVVGANVWLGANGHAVRSAVTTSAPLQQAQPQQAAVQAEAAPVLVDSVSGRPVQDASVVLVDSDALAASAEQSLDQADALRATLGLTAINASIVLATGEQTISTVQAIDAADALRAQWAAPPLAVVDLR